MAKRQRSRRSRRDHEDFPGWVWMLFGLSIGLAVAFAVWINSQTEAPATAATPARQAAADRPDRNGETPAAQPEEEETAGSRFDFYDMLPKFEVVIPEQEPDVTADVVPRAIVEPGEYVLQAGSFTRYEDADRRRAELAMQGIESTIQRVAIDDRTYHRVRIGPTRDLDKLNQQRARLRKANIDVLRIRLDD